MEPNPSTHVTESLPPAPLTPSSEDRMLAMLCHLGGLFTGFIVPLIIWIVKKDTSPFVDDQGKESLNFQLSLLIYYLVSAIAILAFIGFFMLLGLLVFETIVIIMASVAANQGQPYRYPLTIRFIK